MSHNILIVDDEDFVRSALKRALADEPYNIIDASSAEQGLEILKDHTFQVVLSDERMPGMQGSEFLALVRNRYPYTVRMLLTGHATIESAMDAVNQGGIYRFFIKPWNDTEIRCAIRSALEKYSLEEENRRLLTIVRAQELELHIIEKRFPGIARIERNDDGSLVVPELSEDELKQLIQTCNQTI